MRSPSYIRNAPPKKRKKYNPNLIKQAKIYTINEICALFNIHKNTVLSWVKAKLKPIDNSRPMLFIGAELKAFITKRQEQKKRKCAFNQIYCLKCRSPQEPANMLADLTFKTDKIANLAALCAICCTPINRLIKRADISKFEKVLSLKQLGQPTLSAPSNPNLNSDSRKDTNQC